MTLNSILSEFFPLVLESIILIPGIFVNETLRCIDDWLGKKKTMFGAELLRIFLFTMKNVYSQQKTNLKTKYNLKNIYSTKDLNIRSMSSVKDCLIFKPQLSKKTLKIRKSK